MASIDYIAKDFDSIVDALITFATVNFGPDTAGNRQWTSFNSDDFSRTWLELVAFVGDLIFFYLDVQATQSNLQTATIRSAVLDIAKQFGFVVSTAVSASGAATFTLSSPGTIPVGFRVSADNGSEFFVASSSPQAGSTTLSPILPVIQGEQRTETFTALGVQNEEIVLGFTPLVVDTTNSITTLRSPRITVNGNSFDLVNTFIDSLPTNDHFRLLTNDDGRTIVRFGDGVFGSQLAPNDSIVVNYRTGGGSIGNIPSGTLSTLVDSATFVTGVTNTEAFGGGSDEPSIDRLRELIPASLTTLERAVAVDDYGNIIIANFNNVLKAAAEENITDSGIDVDIYVVPQGNTITPVTTNLTLFNSITNFIDKRKTVTTTFRLLDANGIEVDLKLLIFLTEGASRTEVTESLNTLFEDFFNIESGDIDEAGTKFGQRILLNDIYDLVDQIEGIDRFEIEKFNYIPRVEDTTATGTNYLIGSIEVLEPAERSEWIVASEENISSPDNNPFTVYRRIKGTVSNLSADSLADDSLNLSVVESETDAINTDGSNNIVFDNSRTFLVDQFVGGGYLFVDSSQNVWSILDNDAHSITLSEFAINNTIVSDVSDGSYKIVKSLIGQNLLFRGLIFSNIDFNTHNTIFRIGSSFDLVGTIGDSFNISEPQTNTGSFGLPVTISSFTSSTPTAGSGQIKLSGNPDLSGVSTGVNGNDVLIDSDLNIFEITAVDDIQKTVNILHQAGSTVSPVVSGGSPASIAPVYYSDNNEVSFVIGQANKETGLGFQAIGSISAVAAANISDAETFVLEDGTNPAVTFEFDTVPNGVAVGNELVDISGDTSSDDVRDSIIDAINNAVNPLAISASIGDSESPATGSINTVAQANLIDGETFTLNDGVNSAVTFEFDKVPDGVTPGNIIVDISADVTADDIKSSIISAINGAASLDITAGDGGTGIVSLTNDASGIFGNQTITDTVNNIGFTTTGMSGGTAGTVFLQNNNLGTIGNQAIIEGVADASFTVSGMSGGLDAGSSPTPVIPAAGKNSNDFGLDSDGNIIDRFEFRISGFVDDIVNLRKSEIPQFSNINLELDLRGGVA